MNLVVSGVCGTSHIRAPSIRQNKNGNKEIFNVQIHRSVRYYSIKPQSRIYILILRLY
jgi:hypothetical protein